MKPKVQYDLTFANKAMRGIWGVVNALAYRRSPVLFHSWRRLVLRCFGAKIGARARPYPRANIWAPWNLTMEAGSCLANDVDCYCVAPIHLGQNAIVSQYAYLCSASHDYDDPSFPLVISPIAIGAEAWVAAQSFVGPGVTVGAGAVVGARATVLSDVAEWAVVVGTPARVVKMRKHSAKALATHYSPDISNRDRASAEGCSKQS